MAYLPFEQSQRGDSGTNQMRQTWMTEGRACSAEGMRQDQLLGMLKVPKVYIAIRQPVRSCKRRRELTVQAALHKPGEVSICAYSSRNSMLTRCFPGT